MQCPNGCDVPMEMQKMQKLFYRRDEPVVISDLMIAVCSECGQEAMPLNTARIVEDVLNGRKIPAGTFTAELFKG